MDLPAARGHEMAARSRRHSGCRSPGVYTGTCGKSRSPCSNPRPPGPALRFAVAGLLVSRWPRPAFICQRRPDQPHGPAVGVSRRQDRARAKDRNRLSPANLQEELGIRRDDRSPRVTPHPPHNYRHGGAVDLQFFAVPALAGRTPEQDALPSVQAGSSSKRLPDYEFLAADRA